MAEFRLGDDIDDYCVKCRRLTNHAIVSLMGTQPAKMRCRTCYHEHDFPQRRAAAEEGHAQRGPLQTGAGVGRSFCRRRARRSAQDAQGEEGKKAI